MVAGGRDAGSQSAEDRIKAEILEKRRRMSGRYPLTKSLISILAVKMCISMSGRGLLTRGDSSNTPLVMPGGVAP